MQKENDDHEHHGLLQNHDKESTANETKNEEKETEKPASGSSGLGRLLSYSKKYWIYLLLANTCLLINSLTMIAIPSYCGLLLDEINKRGKNIEEIGIHFLIIGVVNAIANMCQMYLFDNVGQNVIRDIRSQLFTSIMHKDVDFFEQRQTGELMSRLSSDTSEIQNTSSHRLSSVLRSCIEFAGALTVMLYISWKLSLILLSVIPVLAILTLITSAYGRTYAIQFQDSIAESATVAEEAISNARTVKAFACEDKESRVYCSKLDKTYGVGKRKSLLWSVFSGFTNFLINAGILTVLYFGGMMILNDEITSGQLSSFIIYAMMLGLLASTMSTVVGEIVSSLAACDRVFAILDHIPRIKTEGGIKPETMQGEIALEQVTFKYPAKENVTILKNVSVTINKGEFIGLVGSSGSGKSSTISLIQRFYDPTEGRVVIDGHDLRDLNLNWVHKNIGFVSQEPSLFSGTIEENIVYGVDSYTKEELDNAVRMANAYDFIHNIEQFPNGYKTQVGQKGVQLSGGQKQRIAIARALMKNPPVLILDEATSALDAESEHQVQSAIENIMSAGNKTIIIIAHRLSTILKCKRILVLHSGVIVEEGSHEVLIHRNGIYKALVERQISSMNNS
eukprot:TRINITY_DN5125_c0_g1_i6.p1 TRINITY_DN5125_c0_g1~~TRINITY_DN5125_c0_g1_i6.p1  ORF type:complete len:621 (-),score=116.14 TRINITY_DN5125_c0_g1_i6:604-2466(-)